LVKYTIGLSFNHVVNGPKTYANKSVHTYRTIKCIGWSTINWL